MNAKARNACGAVQARRADRQKKLSCIAAMGALTASLLQIA